MKKNSGSIFWNGSNIICQFWNNSLQIKIVCFDWNVKRELATTSIVMAGHGSPKRLYHINMIKRQSAPSYTCT